MNIKNQVLSLEQVQELIDLGFDVEKYSSMYFVPNWITKYGIDEIQDYLLTIGELGDDYEGDCIPTMSIGDIIEVLPNLIIIERFLYRLEINNPSVYYIDRIKNTGIYFYNNGLIDNLFETLKWCIKEKHIEL